MGKLLTVHRIVHETTDAKKLRRVRVAILDTGASFGQNYLSRWNFRDRLIECRTWIGPNSSRPEGLQLPRFQDADPKGHGTHSTSAFHEIAPVCDIYVAQVFSTLGNIDQGHRRGRAEEEEGVANVRSPVLINISLFLTTDLIRRLNMLPTFGLWTSSLCLSEPWRNPMLLALLSVMLTRNKSLCFLLLRTGEVSVPRAGWLKIRSYSASTHSRAKEVCMTATHPPKATITLQP
jgi:hypothetical protein